jgi:hypothetical protein
MWMCLALMLALSTATSFGNLDQGFFSADLADLTIFDVDGHRAFLLIPKSQHTNDNGPWVWFAPTFVQKDLPPLQVNRYLFDELLRNGIQLAGVDAGESYGSPNGTKIYSSFYYLLIEKYHVSARPCLFAQSRGGLMLYNWAEQHADSVRCIGAIFPVTDLRTWPLSVDSHQQYEDAKNAYGMKGRDQEYRKQLEAFSPINHLASLAQHKVPIFHLHGDSDRWVPFSPNSCALAKRYTAMGGDAKVQVIKGKGHEEADAFFKSCDLLDFFVSNLVQSPSIVGHCPKIDSGTCPQ